MKLPFISALLLGSDAKCRVLGAVLAPAGTQLRDVGLRAVEPEPGPVGPRVSEDWDLILARVAQDPV